MIKLLNEDSLPRLKNKGNGIRTGELGEFHFEIRPEYESSDEYRYDDNGHSFHYTKFHYYLDVNFGKEGEDGEVYTYHSGTRFDEDKLAEKVWEALCSEYRRNSRFDKSCITDILKRYDFYRVC